MSTWESEHCPNCGSEPYDPDDEKAPNYLHIDSAWLCGSYRPYHHDIDLSPVCKILQQRKPNSAASG